MPRNTFEVDWAKELGIYVPHLQMEHPGHPFQLQNKKIILKKGEVYWRRKEVEKLWEDDDVQVGASDA